MDRRLSLMLRSYERFAGKPLCAPDELQAAAFVVLAHGIEASPVLFYGNAAALTLWEMTWGEFTSMPSRQTAEADVREVRAKLLADVERDGFTDRYTGVRVSASGRRFLIEDAFVWNILDDDDTRVGQAATFDRWRYLAPGE